MDRRTAIPIFPDAPREGYTFPWGSGLVRALEQMAQVLRNPGESRATTSVITNMPTSDAGLEEGSLFRQGNQVFITTGSAATTSFTGNRLINASMIIDQRNAGASVANIAGGVYTLDRWNAFGSVATKFTVQQNAGSVTLPPTHRNYLGVTSSSAYSVGASESFSVRQLIEAVNTADLGFGTSTASTVTLSFWVRSSLTGNFGGCIYNESINRFYPFSYTISAANTWEKKAITLAGDVTGTWTGVTNTIGIGVQFSLGAGATVSGTANAWTASLHVQPTGSVSVVGTSGATWYITAVQFEAGSAATPLERRLYGQELALCQRYYQKVQASAAADILGTGYSPTTTSSHVLTNFLVEMRTKPTALEQSGNAADYAVLHQNTTINCSSVPIYVTANRTAARTGLPVAAGLTQGQGAMAYANNTSAYFAWSAEL